MNAIIPQRQRILNPTARPAIRAMMSRCAAEVLIAEFGFGGSGEKLKRLEDAVDKRLRMYSGFYSRYNNEKRALEHIAKDALAYGIDCGIRPGSGEKVLVGHEHDMLLFAYLIELHRLEGYAGKRLDRFQSSLSKKIRYYNNVLDGAPEMVTGVMDDRLGRYGKEPSKQFEPVKIEPWGNLRIVYNK